MYRQLGEWFAFGHSDIFYRVTGESAAVTLPSYKQEGIPADAKLVESRVVHTDTWGIPTIFYDEHYMYLRGRSYYGCLGLGDANTQQHMVKVDYLNFFDGKIVDMATYGYNTGIMSLVLTEHGTLYAAGYGGRGLYYMSAGKIGVTASYSTWQKLSQ